MGSNPTSSAFLLNWLYFLIREYVTWGINASGPTLLKGGPGTGKSTIALYRVRSFVHELRKKGHTDFRILFTTYTSALVESSKQQLQHLQSHLAQRASHRATSSGQQRAYEQRQHFLPGRCCKEWLKV